MAGFPTELVPTARSFNPGDWPVKQYTSENGTEIRILRGSARLNSTLELTYDNIADGDAEKFLQHYREVYGTYKAWNFSISPSDVGAFKGWTGSSTKEFEASPWGMSWRYDRPPEITQVKRGRSSVRIMLKGVSAT